MAIAFCENFAVVCLNAIEKKKERQQLLKHLKSSGKEIISISEDQVTQFAGNILQVIGINEKRFRVMSKSAAACLTDEQQSKIEKHCEILSSSLDTIETCGGGTARYMMAEVFLPKG